MKITTRMKLKFTLMMLSAFSFSGSSPLCASPPEMNISRERNQMISAPQVIATAMLSSQQELLGLPETVGQSKSLKPTAASQGPKGLVCGQQYASFPQLGRATLGRTTSKKIIS